MFQRLVPAFRMSLTLTALMATHAVAQPSDAFQVTYAPNLVAARAGLTSGAVAIAGDSVINITNANTSGGNICVNVYAFSPDEQLVSCCACPVTPNGLVSLSARNDLISNTLTPGVPTSIVIKLLATTAPVGGCNAASPTAASLVAGMRAWATHLHIAPFGLTEDAAQTAALSAVELAKLTSLCGFIQANGSGFGICRSCRLGGLAGVKN